LLMCCLHPSKSTYLTVHGNATACALKGKKKKKSSLNTDEIADPGLPIDFPESHNY